MGAEWVEHIQVLNCEGGGGLGFSAYPQNRSLPQRSHPILLWELNSVLWRLLLVKIFEGPQDGVPR